MRTWPQKADTAHWPEYERRNYEWAIAMGNIWVALADDPILRRIGPLRREFDRRAILSFAAAVEAEREALALLAVMPPASDVTKRHRALT